MATLVEVCVDALDAALEAEAGGAGRIELCGELLQGGVTPSAGLIDVVCEAVTIPVFVLIRPRVGDFLYSPGERDVMRRDIAVAKSLGAAGVVFGALTADGDIDEDITRELVAAARPMAVTFHRAFDFARDPFAALEALRRVGVDRVLTSGGGATAIEGAPMLRALHERAAGAIVVMAGGSVTATNVAAVVRRSGVREVHSRAAAAVESEMRHWPAGVSLARPQAPGASTRMVARAGEVADLVRATASNDGSS